MSKFIKVVISLCFRLQSTLFLLLCFCFVLIYFIIKEHFHFRTVVSSEEENPVLKFRFVEFDIKEEDFLISFSQ